MTGGYLAQGCTCTHPSTPKKKKDGRPALQRGATKACPKKEDYPCSIASRP